MDCVVQLSCFPDKEAVSEKAYDLLKVTQRLLQGCGWNPGLLCHWHY